MIAVVWDYYDVVTNSPVYRVMSGDCSAFGFASDVWTDQQFADDVWTDR